MNKDEAQFRIVIEREGQEVFAWEGYANNPDDAFHRAWDKFLAEEDMRLDKESR